jgi:hypothetical protein
MHKNVKTIFLMGRVPILLEKRTVHAVGDGTFIVDGRKLSRKKMMASKIPNGI